VSVPSPCINVCRMNPSSGWCEGCYRTLDEIVQWATADELYKQRVWAELVQRRQSAACIRQGALPDCRPLLHHNPPKALAQHFIDALQAPTQDSTQATNEPSSPSPPLA
jgi:uncharacterized protein